MILAIIIRQYVFENVSLWKFADVKTWRHVNNKTRINMAPPSVRGLFSAIQQARMFHIESIQNILAHSSALFCLFNDHLRVLLLSYLSFRLLCSVNCHTVDSLVIVASWWLWAFLWSRLFRTFFFLFRGHQDFCPFDRDCQLTASTFPVFSSSISPAVLVLVVGTTLYAPLVHIIQASMASGLSLIAVYVAISFFMSGSLIFFLCKFSPSVIRQVPVVASLSLLKLSGSLPDFLLNAGWLKKIGYSVKFACHSLPLHDCSLLALLCT